MKKILLLCFPLLFVACAEVATDTTQSIRLSLQGDMLFEGANTLQMSDETSVESLASALNVSPEQITKVGVAKASLAVAEGMEGTLESFLLQIVSNENDLTSIGTYNPIEKAGTLSLQLAEDINLLPYFKDEGTTFVLDVNLSEDYLDPLVVDGKLELIIEYKP